MFELLLGAFILAIIFLGVKIFLKFRDIASWKTDDESRTRVDHAHRKLGELNIETPPPDAFDSLDSPEQEENPAKKPPQHQA